MHAYFHKIQNKKDVAVTSLADKRPFDVAVFRRRQLLVKVAALGARQRLTLLPDVPQGGATGVVEPRELIATERAVVG